MTADRKAWADGPFQPRFTQWRVPRRLQGFVREISVSQSQTVPETAETFTLVAEGTAEILCTLPLDPEGRPRDVAQIELWGPKTSPRIVGSEGPCWKVGLRLETAAMSRITRRPATEVCDRAVSLDELLGRPAKHSLRALSASLAERRGAPQAFGDVLRWAGDLRAAAADGGRAEGERALVRAAAEALRVPDARVERLCLDLGVSRRRLERIFLRRVGMAPKRFARIGRFQEAWRRVQAGGRTLDVALDLGYYDQSHLARDLRELGVGPGRDTPSDAFFLDRPALAREDDPPNPRKERS